MARESSSRDRSWRFLERHLLVVAVDGLRVRARQFSLPITAIAKTHLLRIDSERPLGRARAAEADLDLGARVLVERPQDLSTPPAVELDILELGEDATPPRDDSAHAHERVEMDLTQVAQGVAGGEFGDSDVDFGVDAGVGGVEEEDNVEGDFVEEGEHGGGRVGEEVGEDRFAVREVEERDVEGLGVDCVDGVSREGDRKSVV